MSKWDFSKGYPVQKKQDAAFSQAAEAYFRDDFDAFNRAIAGKTHAARVQELWDNIKQLGRINKFQLEAWLKQKLPR